MALNLQAILFQNDRALGRLVSPQLRIAPLHAADEPSYVDHEAQSLQSSMQKGACDTGAALSSHADCTSSSVADKAASCCLPTKGSLRKAGASDHVNIADGTKAACQSKSATQSTSQREFECHELLVHDLTFDKWQPVWTDFRNITARPSVLHIPVNASWRSSEYRVEVHLPMPP